jgi:hypothetical protein
MEEPAPQQEETKGQTVAPSEVWEQLSPDLQRRITRLFARMAYKYALAQRRSSPEKDGGAE